MFNMCNNCFVFLKSVVRKLALLHQVLRHQWPFYTQISSGHMGTEHTLRFAIRKDEHKPTVDLTPACPSVRML